MENFRQQKNLGNKKNNCYFLFFEIFLELVSQEEGFVILESLQIILVIKKNVIFYFQ